MREKRKAGEGAEEATHTPPCPPPKCEHFHPQKLRGAKDSKQRKKETERGKETRQTERNRATSKRNEKKREKRREEKRREEKRRKVREANGNEWGEEKSLSFFLSLVVLGEGERVGSQSRSSLVFFSFSLSLCDYHLFLLLLLSLPCTWCHPLPGRRNSNGCHRSGMSRIDYCERVGKGAEFARRRKMRKQSIWVDMKLKENQTERKTEIEEKRKKDQRSTWSEE